MKIIVILLSTLAFASPVFSQGTAGLIAHWKMNGNALDASGNGHHGVLRNIKSGGGKAGTANTALLFNGTNSYMAVPDASDLNVTNYSICATVKLGGFYTGLCDANIILSRGRPGNTGSYDLYVTNEPFQGCTCAGADTTEYNFCETAGANPANCSGWYYTPTIQENKWYSVVGTWDGANFKIYVDGAMMTNNPSTSPGPIGSNNDSIVIGMDTWDALAGYPYPFKGAIDDIRLYNRVLTGTEINDYTNSTLDVPTTANSETEIAVYPNPAGNKINLQLGDNTIKGTVQLLNELGQSFAQKEINNGAVNFDISNIPKGIYLLRIESDEQVFYRKFIKN